MKQKLTILTENATTDTRSPILDGYNSGFYFDQKEDKSVLTQVDKNAFPTIHTILSDTSIPVLREEGEMISCDERKNG